MPVRPEDPIHAVPSRRASALALGAVVLSAVALYANTLRNGFVYDDRFQVLRNPWLPDVEKILTAFTTDVWAFQGGGSNYYRPLMHVAYILTYQAFGLDAWGFHAVNVALHALASALVFLLARRLLERAGQPPSPALAGGLVAGLLFAAHPIHTEVVAWVACVPDLLLAILACGAILLELRGSPLARAGAVACFFAGLFAKETMATVPLALVAYDLATARPRLLALVRRYLPYAAATALYLAIRLSAISGMAPMVRHPELGATGVLVNVFPLFADYLGALALPMRQSAFHVLHPVPSLLSARGLAGLGATLAFLACLRVAWRRASDAVAGLTLLAAPLLPVLYIPALGENTFAERYLYLPSAGYAILAGGAAARALARGPALRAAVIGGALAVVAAYTAVTVPRNAVWRSELSLWTATAAASPDSAYARGELGSALAEIGRVAEAVPEFQAAIRLEPGAALHHNNLGVAYERLGRPDAAEAAYLAALRADPRNPQALVNLGNVRSAAGRFAEAAEAYREAARLQPAAVEPRISLGNALAGLGDRAGAMAEYQAALALDPRSADAQLALGIALAEGGRLADALPHLEAAQRLAPDDEVIRANLLRAYRIAGRPAPR